MIRPLLSCLLACLLFTSAAGAQDVVPAPEGVTARLIRTSVMLDQPRGDGFVVISVPPGVVVEVLGQLGQWYQVRLLREFNVTRPSGWLHRDVLELLPSQTSPTSIPFTSPDAPLQPTNDATATNRRGGEGVWFSVGLGYGSLGCEGCNDRVSGTSGGLAVGGQLTDRVLLGVGTTGWFGSRDGVSLNAATVEARARLYPSPTSGFFINGGAGIGTTVRLGVAPGGSERETGFGLSIGAGWDIPVSSKVSLTPFWNQTFVATSSADANYGQFGLGITIH